MRRADDIIRPAARTTSSCLEGPRRRGRPAAPARPTPAPARDAASDPRTPCRRTPERIATRSSPCGWSARAAAARLYEQGIPNAIFASLGWRFTAAFLEALVGDPGVCAFAGLREDGSVAGMIVGTLHRGEAYGRAMAGRRLKLALAAGPALLRPRVVRWVAWKVARKLRRGAAPVHLPDAELLVISVDPDARGSRLAHRLVARMDAWFLEQGFGGEYVILTEVSNERANRFYRRLGARPLAVLPGLGGGIQAYGRVPDREAARG